MGCGKTTFGRKLASKLDYAFLDLDHAFEEVTGLSIPNYFKQHGEEKFRKTEQHILQNSHYHENVVVATGGGLPWFYDNMDWMNANGTTVYLKMPARALADRLEKADEERPLLQDYRGEALVNFIFGKLQEREPFYTKAHLSISGLSITPEKLLIALEEHQRR